jgi:hypothetical protein
MVLVEYIYRRIARYLILAGLGALLFGAFELFAEARRVFAETRAEARVEWVAERCVATVSVMGAGLEKIGTCAELKALRSPFAEVSEPAPVTIAHAVLLVAGQRHEKDFRLDPDEVAAVKASRRIPVSYDAADPAAFREPAGFATIAASGTTFAGGLAMLAFAFAAHRLSRLRAEAAEAARDALWDGEDRAAAERGDARAPAGFGARKRA